jgi:hypothetical protein
MRNQPGGHCRAGAEGTDIDCHGVHVAAGNQDLSSRTEQQ